jgi:hypothetical protein
MSVRRTKGLHDHFCVVLDFQYKERAQDNSEKIVRSSSETRTENATQVEELFEAGLGRVSERSERAGARMRERA